jgi:acetolactate synthase-1/3 small subunit
MTIVVNVVEEQEVERIKLQLDKQIDVIQITDISEQIALSN